MTPSQRQRIAERTRYRVHLDPTQAHVALIEEFFMPLEQYQKHDKLDRAVINKVAHWFGVYVRKMNKLGGEFSSLKTQFSLAATLTGVEASMGMPKNDSTVDRMVTFYEANLTPEDQRSLARSITPYSLKGIKGSEPLPHELKAVIGQLVQRRHGLLHRAELVSLAEDGDTVLARGHTIRGKGAGKIQYALEISLTPDAFTDYTLKALKNYFNTGWSSRTPQQDFSIHTQKKRQPRF